VLLSLTSPSDEAVRRALEQDRGTSLTYTEVGATFLGERPAGYRHDRWEVDLGADEGDRFARAGDAVLAWEAQRGAGIRVLPSQPAAPGLEVALVLRLPIGFALATARVVQLERSDACIGFAYGTLRSHPEQGEELFAVRRAAGRVTFEVAAFSRPRDPLARLGGPVTRWLQLRTNRTYLEALRRIAA
jgi:uncharacterized protein (UPF0548 family)